MGLPNIQATQGGIFLILLIFLGIIPILGSLMREFKDQWFSMWCQTRSSLSSRHRRSSVEHRLAMSSLVSSDPITYFSTSSRLVGILDGLLVGVRNYSTAYRLLYWPKMRISGCLPRDLPWCAPIEWQIWVDLTLYDILLCLLGIGAPWNPTSWARKVLIGHQNWVPRSVPL